MGRLRAREGDPIRKSHKILTDYYAKLYEKDVLLKRILDKVPSAKLNREYKELKQRLSDLPEVTILNLIYQKTKYEGMANDAEFSSLSMRITGKPAIATRC